MDVVTEAEAEVDEDRSYSPPAPSAILIPDVGMGSVPLPLADILGEAPKPVLAESEGESPKDAVADVGIRVEGADAGLVRLIAAVLPSPLDPPRGM